jgi:hypothetical protein
MGFRFLAIIDILRRLLERANLGVVAVVAWLRLLLLVQ